MWSFFRAASSSPMLANHVSHLSQPRPNQSPENLAIIDLLLLLFLSHHHAMLWDMVWRTLYWL